MAQGYVSRRVDKTQRRGRPRHLYSATDLAVERIFPPSPHVLPSLIEAIEAHGGPELRRAVFHELGQVLARRYRKQLHALSPRDRLIQLSQLLERDGVLISVETDGGKIILRERSCPFINMLDLDRTACEMERDMYAGLVGCPVRLADCRLDGCPSCAFELDLESAEDDTATTQAGFEAPPQLVPTLAPDVQPPLETGSVDDSDGAPQDGGPWFTHQAL